MRRPPGLPRLRNCRILSCGTCTAAWVPSGCTWGAMPGAVRYARGNAKALGRKAYKVEQGDAKSVLGRLVKLGPKPDVVVVDPPRAGIDAKVAQQLAEAAPLRLIYVSCNPATLARDVARLAPAFRLKAARPVDLFPQTPHVEAVALLERA